MKACLLICCAAISASISAAGPFSVISDSEKLTAVSSSAHNGYVRTRMADGSFRPETYAFGEGGVTGVLTISDPTFDNVGFLPIARMLAVPLATQNYLPTRDPNATDLLIMVYWGTTTGGVNTSDGFLRDQLNYANAQLLGFNLEGPFRGMRDPMSDPSEVFFGPSFRQTMLNTVYGDVMAAIEVDRYWVILEAYDFQSAWKHKKLKLLWETRFSLSARRHDFERDLPAMAQSASLYFGRDSFGLVLKPVPEGRVDIGEAKVVEDQAADDMVSSGDLSGVAGDWRGRSSNFRPVIFHIRQAGGSTLESPTNHVVWPAVVKVNGSDVKIMVPGRGVIFSGTLKGSHMSGSLTQYGKRSSFTLSRRPAAIPVGQSDSADAPGK